MIQAPVCQEESGIASLKELLNTMTKKLEKPLSPKATHAAQILLWKVSEVMFVQEKHRLASLWCRVALHMVFDKSGELNYGKIAHIKIRLSQSQSSPSFARKKRTTLTHLAIFP